MTRIRFTPVAPVIMLKKEEPKEMPKEEPKEEAHEEPKEILTEEPKEEPPQKYVHPEKELAYRNISIKALPKKIIPKPTMNERLSTPFERIICGIER